MSVAEPDSLDRLAGFSGQSREALQAIWAEVKANGARLEACAGHDFGELRAEIGARYQCAVCGGIARGPDVHWYQKGLAHGRAGR